MVKLSIEFDRPTGIYYAGEIISGTVALLLSDNIDLKGKLIHKFTTVCIIEGQQDLLMQIICRPYPSNQ